MNACAGISKSGGKCFRLAAALLVPWICTTCLGVIPKWGRRDCDACPPACTTTAFSCCLVTVCQGVGVAQEGTLVRMR